MSYSLIEIDSVISYQYIYTRINFYYRNELVNGFNFIYIYIYYITILLRLYQLKIV